MKVDGFHRKIDATDDPAARFGTKTELVRQHALGHDSRVMAIDGQLADPLAVEILGPFDAGMLVDIDRGMAKGAIGEHGYRNERPVRIVDRPQKIGHAEFGDMEGAATDHRLEDLGHDACRVKLRVDTLDLNPTVDQRLSAIVIPKGNVELELRLELRHGGLLVTANVFMMSLFRSRMQARLRPLGFGAASFSRLSRAKDGGHDRDRTCDPYHVKVVLSR